MTLRRFFFWLHLSVGLVVGLLIAFLALTGGIISFQPQLVTFTERGIRADHPGHHRLRPALHPPLPTLPPRPPSPSPASPSSPIPTAPPRSPRVPKAPVLLADSCTGRILGPGANHLRVFLATVRELHHQATFQGVHHETLRALKNAAALAFVFLTLSGLYLWFPRYLTWQHLRPTLLFRPGLRGRAREWNLHNLAGFWLCLPLLAISTTGVIMAFPWANNLLYRAAGDTPPPPRRESAPQPPSPQEMPASRHIHPASTRTPADFTPLDAPIARALSFQPATVSTTLRLPPAKALASTPSLTFQLARNDCGQSMNRDQLTVATADAAVLKFEPFAQASRGRRWRITARYLHTGELFGAPGQAIALTAALGALLLVWTGFSLAVRRLAAFRHRRQRTHPQTPPLPTPTADQEVQVS